ncbi:heavy metal-associated isoprenylated plant protein 9-like isoform X2 [Abrus precatorius]|uniref:Heavy metal-associated isoprenylated plant protein 9-like isoform X2 n=1 Tax=Abrus precatorius TaxID=3816 RepID=A0A8B8K888_ABRPR|nr:heavy metal-associated isoprenylated plant protein 9-like isoform X2 [Abrus precatorius]
MGEEAKQVESKPEEKPAEEKKEEKPVVEEKKEPKPQSPCVLFVDLHCVGCAKKIQKYIMKMRGVERVVFDMAKNEVTIKGIVEPQAICNMITKKTKRIGQVLSPLPVAEGEPIPEVVTSQVSGPVTVELNVNMHCEACAEQLKGKILKMRGVQTAVAEFSTGKVIVTGTMDANKLVDYVYRRTKKRAKIVPQPEPEPEKEKEYKEAEKPTTTEAAKPEGKKEEETESKEEEKPAEEPKKEEEGGEGGKDMNENKEEKGGEEEAKKEVGGDENEVVFNVDEEDTKRVMYYYQPLYVIERIPPPQLFSEENPNACCIS